MRINIILFNVLLLIFLFLLIYLYLYINYNNNIEKFSQEEVKVFTDTSNNPSQSTNVITDNNTTNTQQLSLTDLAEDVVEDYKGMDPKDAFDNVGVIMAINNARNYLSLKGVSNYGNGYYWINLSGGAKLLFIITDTSVQGGGWVLIMRATLGSPSFNLTSRRRYINWTNNKVTPSSKARALLSLQMREQNGLLYNPSIGLFNYNDNLSKEFSLSSVGKYITSTNRDYDCKFSTYNEYMFREVMVKFHFLQNNENMSYNAYMRVPNKDIDDYSAMNSFLKSPFAINPTVYNAFNINENMDLMRNFRLNITNIDASIPSQNQTSKGISEATKTTSYVMSVNCLLGIHGTFPSKLRYIIGIGVSDANSLEKIQSSAVFITVPEKIDNANQITITPIAYELFVK